MTLARDLEKLGATASSLDIFLQILKRDGDAYLLSKLKEIPPKYLRRMDRNILKPHEEIVLLTLLSCPLLSNEQLAWLLKINEKNKRRAVSALLNRSEKYGLTKRETCGRGRGKGNFGIWLITPKGYLLALKLLNPEKKDPVKFQFRNKNDCVNHDLVISDIFLDVMAEKTLQETRSLLNRFVWRPKHESSLGFFSQFELRRKQGRTSMRKEYIYPDAMVEDMDSQIRILLEVDMDSKTLSQEREKLRDYLAYFLETREVCDFKRYLLIYSVPNEHRGKELFRSYTQFEREEVPDELRCYLPDFKIFLHKETGKEIRKNLFLWHSKNQT